MVKVLGVVIFFLLLFLVGVGVNRASEKAIDTSKRCKMKEITEPHRKQDELTVRLWFSPSKTASNAIITCST